MSRLAPRRQTATTVCLGVAAILLLPCIARGNIGQRWWGDVTSEPPGFKGVAIIREDLDIDLRPLAKVEPVRVRANYQLNNSGLARRLELVFVSGSPFISDFEVRLGGKLISSRVLSQEELRQHQEKLPENWKPPYALAGFGGEAYAMFHDDSDGLGLVAFSLDLPSGCSTLSASYQARACGSNEGQPTVTWQVPYVLAPARQWDGFGELFVTVHLPEGWESACTPALEVDGSVLRGRFTGLPYFDVFVVAARAPVPPELQRAWYLYEGLYALAVLGGGVLCWLVGRVPRHFLNRIGDKWHWLVDVLTAPLAALAGVGWAAMIFGTWRLGMEKITSTLGSQEGPYFHERFTLWGFGTLLLMLMALPLGFLIVWWSAHRNVQRSNR